MKNDNPDKGLLLIALLITVTLVLIAGLILSVDSAHPISTFMIYVQNGFSFPSTGNEVLDGGSTTEPEFIAPPPPPSFGTEDETTGESPDVSDETSSPETDPPVTTEQGGTESSTAENTSGGTTSPNTTAPNITTKPPENTTTPNVTTKPPENTTKPIDPPKPPVITDDEYFSNTLFIGDSRTAGFYLYARVPKATYFGVTSMSVYNVFGQNTKSETGSTQGKNLVTVLSEKQYKQIYILLGINEIWADPGSIASNFSKVVDSIKLYQPNAKIIIQSNMHVTKSMSDKNPTTFSNKRIDALNDKLKKLADGKTVFYLDFVSIFDDATGAMDPTYSGDGVHLYAKCYKLWRDWIVENGKIY